MWHKHILLLNFEQLTKVTFHILDVPFITALCLILRCPNKWRITQQSAVIQCWTSKGQIPDISNNSLRWSLVPQTFLTACTVQSCPVCEDQASHSSAVLTSCSRQEHRHMCGLWAWTRRLEQMNEGLLLFSELHLCSNCTTTTVQGINFCHMVLYTVTCVKYWFLTWLDPLLSCLGMTCSCLGLTCLSVVTALMSSVNLVDGLHFLVLKRCRVIRCVNSF